MTDLAPGDVIWARPSAVLGRERGGRRPALVIAGRRYLDVVDTLVVVVPITGVDRRWPNHIRVRGSGLDHPSWAMTEQVRTISRDRVVGRAGRADAVTLDEARMWVRDYLDG